VLAAMLLVALLAPSVCMADAGSVALSGTAADGEVLATVVGQTVASRRLLDSGVEKSSSDRLKIGVSFAILAEGILGSLIPIFGVNLFGVHSGYVMSLLNMFSGGVFITIGLSDILVEGIDLQDHLELKYGYPLVPIMTVVGFLIVFTANKILIGSSQFDFSKDGSEATESIDLEKADAEAAGAGVGKTLSRGTEETADEAGKKTALQSFVARSATQSSAIAILCAITVHEIIGDGLAIGIARSYDATVNIIVAVVGTRAFEGISLATRFLKAGATRLEAFLWLMPFFLSTPIAIYIGLALSQTSDTVVAIFQGLSAGTFIYVGAFDVLSNQFGSHQPNRSFWARAQLLGAYMLGALVICLVRLHGEGDESS